MASWACLQKNKIQQKDETQTHLVQLFSKTPILIVKEVKSELPIALKDVLWLQGMKTQDKRKD